MKWFNLNHVKGAAAAWRVPWLAGLAALLIYGASLPLGITLYNAQPTAHLLGWDWSSFRTAPITFLLLYPARWLPVGWQFGAAGLMTAGFGALTLALLARSVSLWPQDRTPAQRERLPDGQVHLPANLGWLASLIAVAACGLQTSFWEHATIATGEMVDLLLFAASVWCLLEYRRSQSAGWQFGFALVFSAGVANNFAMLAFSPFLLAALFVLSGDSLINWSRIGYWLLGRSKENWSFQQQQWAIRTGPGKMEGDQKAPPSYFISPVLGKLACLGLAGLLFYLVLPSYQSLTGVSDQGFLRDLRGCLGAQKHALFTADRTVALVMGLAILTPLAFIMVRWRLREEIEILSDQLRHLWIERQVVYITLHVSHAVILAVTVFLTLDVYFSPQVLSRGAAYLPLYYVNALVLGYCTGYFLLIARGQLQNQKNAPKQMGLERTISGIFRGGIWLLVALPVVLFFRTLPGILSHRGEHLAHYGKLAARILPANGAVVMADDKRLLFAVRAGLGSAANRYQFIHSARLSQPAFQRFLQRRYPDFHPLTATGASNQTSYAYTGGDCLKYLGKKQAIYALQPIQGPLAEQFYAMPDKLLFRLEPRPANGLAGKPPSKRAGEDTLLFWRGFMKEAAGAGVIGRPELRARGGGEARGLGEFYSLLLNYHGVMLQRAGELPWAAECFNYAVELNPDNQAALGNRELNQAWQQQGRPLTRLEPQTRQRLLPLLARWDWTLVTSGPVDEPGAYFSLALYLRGRHWHRQAIDALQRAIFFMPDECALHALLASSLASIGMTDSALEEISAFRARAAKTRIAGDAFTLVQAESHIRESRKEHAQVDNLLAEAMKENLADVRPVNLQVHFWLERGQAARAQALLEHQVKLHPTNASFLVNLAGVMQLRQNAVGALPYLERANQASPGDPLILQNRGLAYRQTGNLKAALNDFEAVRTKAGSSPAIVFCLAEVNYLLKEYQLSRSLFETFLKTASSNNPDLPKARKYLKAIETGTPPEQ
ncbi:MAG: hypothetical protein WCO56_20385 [Verrucomicrobiota bacterium]